MSSPSIEGLRRKLVDERRTFTRDAEAHSEIVLGQLRGPADAAHVAVFRHMDLVDAGRLSLAAGYRQRLTAALQDAETVNRWKGVSLEVRAGIEPTYEALQASA